ncbi:MAG: tetraacyldisaccharide 4'-kinase, partial [Rhodospirillaceae bacterium]
MRAPEFWHADGGAARLLAPAGCVYAQAVRLRLRAGGWRAPVPVVCIGNVVAGGAGKTPLAIAAASLLAARGRSPHILSRGYGGLARGPLKVELRTHTAREVGDEPLLLAAAAPTWVARDRAAGARAAVRDGAGALV